jgi:PhnB protein
MSVILNPYISFKDSARQAITFYESVFGGELTISTFADLHAEVQPDELELVMHSQLTAPNGLVLMCSDTPAHMEYNPGNNISVSLSGDEEDVLTGYWNKLLDGGTMVVPLEKAPWGDSFGMLDDKFGIHWLVNITGTA